MSRVAPAIAAASPAVRGLLATRTVDLSVGLAFGEAVALGVMPGLLVQVFKHRAFDLSSHHRRSVLRHHRMPGKRRAQKLLAHFLHRYHVPGKGVSGVNFLREARRRAGGLYGLHESFVAGGGDEYGQGYWLRLEHGGVNRTARPMAILFRARNRTAADLKAHRDRLLARAYTITPTGLLVLDKSKITRRGRYAARSRTEIYGVLRKQATTAPMLGFQERFDSVYPRHLHLLDRDLDIAVAAAQRGGIGPRIVQAGSEETFARQLLNRNQRKGIETHEEAYFRTIQAGVGARMRANRIAPDGPESSR
jgi:hypothetical protein